MSELEVFNWQGLLTEHQVYTWRVVASSDGVSVKTLVALSDLEQRTRQGWVQPNFNGLEIIKLQRGFFGLCQGVRQVFNSPSQSIHCFSGFWGVRRYFLLMIFAQLSGRRTIVMQEPYAEIEFGYLIDGRHIINKLKRLLRPLLYKWASLVCGSAIIRDRLKILAISPRARVQLCSAGFPADIIYPWAYFVPKITDDQLFKPVFNPLPEDKIRLIFVGTLLQRKGIGLLVEAFKSARIANPDILLDIFGYGDASAFDAVDGIRFSGAIPFGATQSVVRNYDILILPSLHDGWGVVVNEALLQGVGVIASTDVGASCVVIAKNAGTTFKSGDVGRLADILRGLNSDKIVAWKRGACAAADSITPEVGGAFLVSIVRAWDGRKFRPTYVPAPWLV